MDVGDFMLVTILDGERISIQNRHQHLKVVANTFRLIQYPSYTISVTKIDVAREITFLISLITKIFVQKIFQDWCFCNLKLATVKEIKFKLGKL